MLHAYDKIIIKFLRDIMEVDDRYGYKWQVVMI